MPAGDYEKRYRVLNGSALPNAATSKRQLSLLHHWAARRSRLDDDLPDDDIREVVRRATSS